MRSDAVRTVEVSRLFVEVEAVVGLSVVKDVDFDIVLVNDAIFGVGGNDALFDMGIIVLLGFTEAELNLVDVDEDTFVGTRVVGFVGIAELADVEIFGLGSSIARRTML